MLQVERIGDMDSKSRLLIERQEDGDIVVRVIENKFGQYEIAEVEFCTPRMGGGQSPATHEALLKLIEAIREDNKKGRAAFTPGPDQYFGSEPE